MKKRLLLSFFIFYPLFLLQAQPSANTTPAPGIGKVSGQVLDADSQAPVEFVTVALMRKSDDKPMDGIITDDKGKFQMKNIEAGTYKVVISFIGYTNKVIDPVVISADNKSINLGSISLEPDVQMLDEIVVEDEKDLIEDKIDRIVYNAEKDITNRGGTAIDVLQNVPMLSVDLDGNVSMRGSENIRVLINNKPSTIMASSVADAIRQIPADQIKSVEVITSPSAKYDAEGTAGIVNIITKKNNLQGISGSVNASGGNRSSSLNGNINYRQKKWGIGVNSGGYTYYPLNNGNTDRINTDEEGNLISVLDQFDEGRTFGVFNNTRLNFDYDFNPKTYISAGARFGVRYRDNDSELSSRLTDANNDVLQFFNSDIENKNRFNTVDVNIDYVKRFEKQGQEFSILGLYSRDFGGNDYTLFQSDSVGTVNYREENDNDSFNEEITFQADYAHPIVAGSLLEFGGKAILRTVNSDFQLFVFDFDQNDFVNVPERSNVFNYTQDVYAGYVSMSYTTKFKLAVKAGVRYERTAIEGDFISTDTRFTQNYDNFVPSVVLSQELKKGMKLKLSYNRRIQRPSIFFLNPYVNTSNALNVNFGNPNLDPELTNNYEMSYNVFFKRNSITTSVYWRQTNNAISSIQTLSGDTVFTTYDNVARNNTYGTSIFAQFMLTKKWRIGGSVDIFYVDFDSPEFENANSDVAYSFRFNTSYQLPKGFRIQGWGFYRSPRVQIQGTQGAFNLYSFGIRKELFKKKGGLTLGMINPFNRVTKIKSAFDTETFTSDSERNIFNRSFRLAFDWRFGDMKFGAKRRRKSIRNDDIKEGGGDGGGQGGGN